jgi:hypothetical protein
MDQSLSTVDPPASKLRPTPAPADSGSVARELAHFARKGTMMSRSLTSPAAYGHFGHDDIELPWERTDKAELLKEVAGVMIAGD